MALAYFPATPASCRSPGNLNMDPRIGILMRNGTTIYYAFPRGAYYVEDVCLAVLEALLAEWDAEGSK